MFTGLIREIGTIESYDHGRLVVRCATRAELGDSVSLDGVCLTVVGSDGGTLAFDVVAETKSRAKPFLERVNVEPAVRAGEPLGGHYVQGHVDGVGAVDAVTPVEDGVRLSITAPPNVLRYCVEKGSITLDGVSLTIARLGETGLEVALVPHTLANTTLSSLSSGDPINLEVDVLAKYVERLLRSTGS